MKPEHDVWKPGQHNGTFRGNNMAFVAATAALDHYWSDANFQATIENKSRSVAARLDKLVQEYPAARLTRRGRGLMQGLAFKDPALASRVTALAFQNGLIIETSGGRDEVVKLLPPLTIEDDQLQEGLDILERALAEAVNQADLSRISGSGRTSAKAAV
jgi:diaminobutyrate-2-oxoglutarate transaminase